MKQVTLTSGTLGFYRQLQIRCHLVTSIRKYEMSQKLTFFFYSVKICVNTQDGNLMYCHITNCPIDLEVNSGIYCELEKRMLVQVLIDIGSEN